MSVFVTVRQELIKAGSFFLALAGVAAESILVTGARRLPPSQSSASILRK